MGVVINEVMVDPVGTDTGSEWIELYNPSNEAVALLNYDLYAAGTYYTFGDFTLDSGTFVVIHINSSGLNTVIDLYQGTSNNMSNISGTIALFKNSNHISSTIIDFIRYGNTATTWQSAAVTAGIWANNDYIPVTGEGNSMGRLPNGHDTNVSIDWTNFVSPTPGQENSISEIKEPDVPDYISPDDNQKFTLSQKIIFSWTEEEGVDYEYQIAKDENFINLIDVNELTIGKYYWRVMAKNDIFTVYTIPRSFEIIELVYSDKIIINELYPDPNSGESEWIELYNNSSETVDLRDWILEDEGLKQYKISNSFSIQPFGFLTISYIDSKITLNNDGDLIKLFDPNGKLVSSTPKYSGGQKGWSFVRDLFGLWSWTTKPTAGAANLMVAPEKNSEETNVEETEDIPKNTTPIEVKTGEVPNYEDYLVKITGTVIETSGNTFYLDDGSGRVKIYIQEATGIDKPPMHKGDIFEIIGIVNFYRGVWRILPQKQEDIKLIRAISSLDDAAAKSSIAKAASAKASTAKKSAAATTKARSPTTQKVAGINSQETKIQAYKSPFWIQVAKAFAGLAIILLILLAVKVMQVKRENPWWTKPIGGDFGDDT